MARDRAVLLVGALAAVVLAAVVGLVLGIAVVPGETTVEGTIVTAQVGNVTDPGDELALVVQGDSRFATRVTDRLETRLSDDGYDVTVVDNPDEVGDGPVLVVDVRRATIDGGLVNRRADLSVESYYASDWNASAYATYRETGSVSQSAPGRIVGGEFRIRDRTGGLSGDYRGRLAGEIVDVVAEDFRG